MSFVLFSLITGLETSPFQFKKQLGLLCGLLTQQAKGSQTTTQHHATLEQRTAQGALGWAGWRVPGVTGFGWGWAPLKKMGRVLRRGHRPAEVCLVCAGLGFPN